MPRGSTAVRRCARCGRWFCRCPSPDWSRQRFFVLVFAWNDFVVAVTMTASQETRTFPVAIYFYLGFYGREWGPLLAASLVSIVPIIAVFVFLQRYFMSGLTGGGVKG